LLIFAKYVQSIVEAKTNVWCLGGYDSTLNWRCSKGTQNPWQKLQSQVAMAKQQACRLFSNSKLWTV